jgi:hypothetical protein
LPLASRPDGSAEHHGFDHGRPLPAFIHHNVGVRVAVRKYLAIAGPLAIFQTLRALGVAQLEMDQVGHPRPAFNTCLATAGGRPQAEQQDY